MDFRILGYYIDKRDNLSPYNVMVVIDTFNERLTFYSPIGQHSEMDRGYLEECRKISKDDYLKYSQGFHTPQEYL